MAFLLLLPASDSMYLLISFEFTKVLIQFLLCETSNPRIACLFFLKRPRNNLSVLRRIFSGDSLSSKISSISNAFKNLTFTCLPLISNRRYLLIIDVPSQDSENNFFIRLSWLSAPFPQ